MLSDPEMARLRREQAEALYWRVKALTDPTQTNPPMSERDAFKLVISAALAERDQIRRALA